jgi:inositol transport system substrate-binding protein
MLEAMLSAIKNGEKTPDKWMDDPGFALTQANLSTRAEEMWGWVLYKEGK